MANMPLAPLEAKAKLDKVLGDADSLHRSALATFKQFDRDGSGTLNTEEVTVLLKKLCENLQLPPIDPNTLQKVISRYDSEEEDGSLSMEEFEKMYRDLLRLIQEKYYPSRTLLVRRSFFVGRTKLKNKEITEYFEFKKKLGAGSFGEVHLVHEKASNQPRVIKTINKQQVALPIEQINAEIEFLKSLDHPNIIKIFDVYEDYNNVYIVQEICAGGELMDRVVEAHQAKKPFGEKSVADIMKRILEVVAYCHEKKIAHKDLKPENVMFLTKDENSPVKVIDFGVAELFNRVDETSRKAAGTALYMAPEVFKMKVGLKCDIWSAGCIMYLLLSGKLPFIGRSLTEVQTKVSLTEPNYTLDLKHISKDGVDVIKSMLIKNPTLRPSCKRILTHPWFRNAKDDTQHLTADICLNLQRYMRQSNLKNALVNMMVHQLNVTAPQIQKLANLFRTLDKDGNGILTTEELTEGLAAAGWKAWDINRVVAALDLDSSGQVDYTEFLAACYTFRESEMNVVWAAFSKMDADCDGKITSEEFINVLSGGNSDMFKKHEIDAMIEQIDRNGDGYVEWDEFLKYVKSET